MKISKYPSEDAVNEAIQNDDPIIDIPKRYRRHFDAMQDDSTTI